MRSASVHTETVKDWTAYRLPLAITQNQACSLQHHGQEKLDAWNCSRAKAGPTFTPDNTASCFQYSTEEENKDRATIIFLIVACGGMFEKRARLLLKRVVTEHGHHHKSASTSKLLLHCAVKVSSN